MIFAVACAVAYYLLCQGKIVWSQAVAGLLMAVFLEIVFGSIVVTRIPDEVHRYNLEVFWSWRAVFHYKLQKLGERSADKDTAVGCVGIAVTKVHIPVALINIVTRVAGGVYLVDDVVEFL